MELTVKSYGENSVEFTEVLSEEGKGILEILEEMTKEGNDTILTKEDLRDLLNGKDKCFVGMGVGNGEKKIDEAVEKALNMIEDDASISRKGRFIVSLSGDVTPSDLSEACEIVRERIGEDYADNVISALYDNSEIGHCTVMVVAT